MELTIRINDEDYERLTVEQRNGISAILELNDTNHPGCSNCVETGSAEEKKAKRSRKTKKEATDDNDTSDAPNNKNNGRLGISPVANDTTHDPASSNENTPAEKTEPTVGGVKVVEPVAEPVAQDSVPTGSTEPTVELPSIEVIQKAGAKFITANPSMVAEFQQLFNEFGIQKISDLTSIPGKIPKFVEAIRAKGVEL